MNANQCLEDMAKRLDVRTEALKLVLLFHSGSPWTYEKRCEWANIIGGLLQNEYGRVPKNYDAATTKNLCDAVRAALKT